MAAVARRGSISEWRTGTANGSGPNPQWHATARVALHEDVKSLDIQVS